MMDFLEDKYIQNYQHFLESITLLKYKLTIFISLLSQNRICTAFIQNSDSKFIGALMSHVVMKNCVKMATETKPVFNGDYLQLYHQSEPDWFVKEQVFTKKSQDVALLCYSKIALVYFLKFLSSEYSRNPYLKNLANVISSLSYDQNFQKIGLSLGSITTDVKELLGLVTELNY
jgi:hypothetical protein